MMGEGDEEADGGTDKNRWLYRVCGWPVHDQLSVSQPATLLVTFRWLRHRFEKIMHVIEYTLLGNS